MKPLASLRIWVLLVMVLWLGGSRTSAANNGFGLSAFSSTNLVFVNNSVTFTINLTNLTGVTLTNVYVTNTFSSPVLVTNISNSYSTNTSAYTNANSLTFVFGPFTNGDAAQLSFQWLPLTPGVLTNSISVATSDLTNTAHTSLNGQVFSVQSDLGVTITTAPQTNLIGDWVTITNDWITYAVTVTNLGPATVPGILLTNMMPTNSILLGVSPAGQSYTTNGNQLVLSVGSLAGATAARYRFSFQPTNAGALALLAGVGAPGLYDTNAPNNLGLGVLRVTNYFPGSLTVTTNSSQVFNPQNGVVEQTIMVANSGATPVRAVRVVVSGLTNHLANASGTNNTQPFVVYAHSLAAGSSVSLRLQYFPGWYFALTNGQLQAWPVPLPNFLPPAAVQTGTNNNFSRILKLTDGDMLLEFPASTGRVYNVFYSDNMSFTNAQIAPPAITAGATRVQWIDYGPPLTVSAPTNSLQRFYRVYLNP